MLNNVDNTIVNITNTTQVIDTTPIINNYEKYQIEVNGKLVPLYVDIQQGTENDDWIVFEKYEDGYLIIINFENKFICSNFNTQASKAASNAIAIVLATSMLKAQNLGLKLSEASLLLKTMNEIMGENHE